MGLRETLAIRKVFIDKVNGTYKRELSQGICKRRENDQTSRYGRISAAADYCNIPS